MMKTHLVNAIVCFISGMQPKQNVGRMVNEHPETPIRVWQIAPDNNGLHTEPRVARVSRFSEFAAAR